MSTDKQPDEIAGYSAHQPSVILLHGNDNLFSIIRSFRKRGIPVHLLNQPRAVARHCRGATLIDLPKDVPLMEAAFQFLVGNESDYLKGSVLLAASDDALECLATHRKALSAKYRLDACNPVAQFAMLDKLQTYRLATDAGVPTPQFWSVEKDTDLTALRDELVYPLLVKPLLSHEFQKKFSRNVKFVTANNFDETQDAVELLHSLEIDVLLLEKIPGPDTQLCSYYTYMHEDGTSAFDFTKRIVRRYPKNMGLATCHVTDHVPDVKDLALRLFNEAGLVGLANAEFKLDSRDDQLKLIECNARFTAANGLVARAGIDLASFVYNQQTGLPLPDTEHFEDDLTMWDPIRDFRAYRELRQADEISFHAWMKSVCKRHTYPCFAWNDPFPAVVRLFQRVGKLRKSRG